MARRVLMMVLLVLTLVVGLVQTTASVDAAGCRCPRVCCYNCDGSFAYCATSHAYCPECAAP